MSNFIYAIYSTSNRGVTEYIDATEEFAEAEYMQKEYQLASGDQFLVEIREEENEQYEDGRADYEYDKYRNGE